MKKIILKFIHWILIHWQIRVNFNCVRAILEIKSQKIKYSSDINSATDSSYSKKKKSKLYIPSNIGLYKSVRANVDLRDRNSVSPQQFPTQNSSIFNMSKNEIGKF